MLYSPDKIIVPTAHSPSQTAWVKTKYAEPLKFKGCGVKTTFLLHTYLHNPNRSLRDLPFGQGHRQCVSPFFSLLMYTRKPQRAPAGGYISTVSCHSYFDRRQVHTRSFRIFKDFLPCPKNKGNAPFVQVICCLGTTIRPV